MKKSALIISVLTGVAGFFLLTNCEKDERIMLSSDKFFHNMEDSTTTSIQVSIPRIEWLPSKNEGGVVIFVSVTDQDGNVLTDFNEYNFRFSHVCKDEPDTLEIQRHDFLPEDDKRERVAVSNTMDYSGSMSNADVAHMEAAVRQFVRMKHAEDYGQIIKFDSRVEIMCEFTRDTVTLLEAIEAPFTRGATAYYRSVDIALDEARDFEQLHRNHLPAVIAFTDGMDNRSHPITLESVIQKSLQYQIPVYTVGFGSVNETAMLRLANESGGRYFYKGGGDGEEIQQIYESISGQLGGIYGFTTETITFACDEVTIVVSVRYRNQHGEHHVEGSRTLNFQDYQ